MSERPISPLRQRMLDDMSVRRFTPDTQPALPEGPGRGSPRVDGGARG